MFVMRFTIIDPAGTVSFVAPCNGLKALVAACSKYPADLASLLDASTPYDTDLKDHVLNSLAIFDEHNTGGNYEQIHNSLDYAHEQHMEYNLPAFRVVDEKTRQASLEPVGAGIVLFNLKERRIIQVHNTYDNIRRQDRGRIHKGGKPTKQLYKYELPLDWQIVP
ncbi:MAG TPA: hypothetical protein VLQ48_15725 [Chloroflexia bacterium]|nr:hypothetical protein [Chloroflexia bacterium]